MRRTAPRLAFRGAGGFRDGIRPDCRAASDCPEAGTSEVDGRGCIGYQSVIRDKTAFADNRVNDRSTTDGAWRMSGVPSASAARRGGGTRFSQVRRADPPGRPSQRFAVILSRQKSVQITLSCSSLFRRAYFVFVGKYWYVRPAIVRATKENILDGYVGPDRTGQTADFRAAHAARCGANKAEQTAH